MYKEKPVATDDIKTVQTSLFSLIKDFFCRNFSPEEMQSTLSYLAAVNDEQQVGNEKHKQQPVWGREFPRFSWVEG